jgi:regulator of protease activity HflC (stomatin/prohibitin superfamily)
MFEESARLVVWLVPIILIAVIFLPQMIRILREYERGVIFRLGKLLGTKGPGLIFLIPIVDRMVRMDLRVVTIDVARQEVPRSRFLFQKVAGFEVVNFDL